MAIVYNKYEYGLACRQTSTDLHSLLYNGHFKLI